jgi:hypothetical protein
MNAVGMTNIVAMDFNPWKSKIREHNVIISNLQPATKKLWQV